MYGLFEDILDDVVVVWACKVNWNTGAMAGIVLRALH